MNILYKYEPPQKKSVCFLFAFLENHVLCATLWETCFEAFKVGVNPSLKKEMWLLMHLITKKTCTKMYKSIHFWNQKNKMNPMVATDFCKIMRFLEIHQ